MSVLYFLCCVALVVFIVREVKPASASQTASWLAILVFVLVLAWFFFAYAPGHLRL